MDWEKITARLNEFLAKGKHNELRGALMMLNPVDIAEYMKSLKGEQLVMVFRILPKDISADVFAYMDDDARKALIESIGDGEIRALISDMFLDDAVDFLEEMPANVVKRILQNADPHTREALNQLLKYPENSAGSIMTIEYCEFHAGTTARQALDEVKRTGIDKETIYTLYVIDRGRHLLGTVALRKLILAADDAPVETLMDASACVSVKTLDDQETVADTVRKYDLLSIPGGQRKPPGGHHHGGRHHGRHRRREHRGLRENGRPAAQRRRISQNLRGANGHQAHALADRADVFGDSHGQHHFAF